MNCLNHYCLIEIFQYNNLKDQMSLYEIKNRSIRAAVRSVWLKDSKCVTVDLQQLRITNDEFNLYFTTIRHNVEVLHLKYLNNDNIGTIKRFRCDRVIEFAFTVRRPVYMTDDDLKDLKDIFPNLRSLSAHGSLTGRHIDQWTLLKALDLTRCSQIAMPYLRNILRNLELNELKLNVLPNSSYYHYEGRYDISLRNFRFLGINQFELLNLVNDGTDRLKELVIYNDLSLLTIFEFIKQKWNLRNIRMVETYYLNGALQAIININFNVEELIIAGDNNVMDYSTLGLFRNLTNLRKLRFVSCKFISSDVDHILHWAPQIIDLSFENCSFDIPIISLQSQYGDENRTQLVTLNTYKNVVRYRSDFVMHGPRIEGIRIEAINFQFIRLTHSKGEPLSGSPLRFIFN